MEQFTEVLKELFSECGLVAQLLLAVNVVQGLVIIKGAKNYKEVTKDYKTLVGQVLEDQKGIIKENTVAMHSIATAMQVIAAEIRGGNK